MPNSDTKTRMPFIAGVGHHDALERRESTMKVKTNNHESLNLWETEYDMLNDYLGRLVRVKLIVDTKTVQYYDGVLRNRVEYRVTDRRAAAVEDRNEFVVADETLSKVIHFAASELVEVVFDVDLEPGNEDVMAEVMFVIQ